MSSATRLQPQTKPVKILYIDHTAKLSGGEIALLRLLSAMDGKRFDRRVVLFSHGEFVDELKKIGLEPIILPLDTGVLNTRKESIGPSLFLRFGALRSTVSHVFALKALIEREKPHVVHTNSLKADIIAGIAARLAGVPVLWHIRDRIAFDYLPPFATWLFRLLVRTIPNYVVTNSHATMETLHLPERMRQVSVVYGGLTFPGQATEGRGPKRASVLYDGIADGQMHRSDNNVHTNTVGLIGRISPWKGQHVFIEAASMVLKKSPETRFQIIGSAMFGEEAYLEDLRKQIDALKVGHAVELVGFRNDIPDVLNRLTIFVHASTLPEPFGQTVLEAMAAGVPTVATNAGAIPEIVTHGESGLLVPPGDAVAMADAILRLLNDREFAQRLAVKSREVAFDRFNITLAANRIQRIYENLRWI